MVSIVGLGKPTIFCSLFSYERLICRCFLPALFHVPFLNFSLTYFADFRRTDLIEKSRGAIVILSIKKTEAKMALTKELAKELSNDLEKLFDSIPSRRNNSDKVKDFLLHSDAFFLKMIRGLESKDKTMESIHETIVKYLNQKKSVAEALGFSKTDIKLSRQDFLAGLRKALDSERFKNDESVLNLRRRLDANKSSRAKAMATIAESSDKSPVNLAQEAIETKAMATMTELHGGPPVKLPEEKNKLASPTPLPVPQAKA